MRKLLLTGAAFIIGASTAHAADPIIYQQPLMSPEPIAQFNWTGFYAGVNAGYGGGKFRHPFSASILDEIDEDGPVYDTFSGSANITAGGFVLGGQVGYNHQFNNWVAGVEADIQWSGIKGEVELNIEDFSVDAGTQVDWFGTLRGRIGHTVTDRFLVYATGGLAYGRVESYANLDGEGVSSSETNWGWTIGAGTEYAFTDRLSWKTEYLYTDLGRSNLIDFAVSEQGVDVFTFNLDNDVRFHTVRTGLNFHF